MHTEVIGSKIDSFRKKMNTVTKMMTLLKNLREDKELILELKGLCPDNKIPKELL